jgi:hypothetical protein
MKPQNRVPHISILRCGHSRESANCTPPTSTSSAKNIAFPVDLGRVTHIQIRTQRHWS